MKRGIEWQIVNRRLSEKLKKSGYPQEGLWYWVKTSRGWLLMKHSDIKERVTAPTVAEIHDRIMDFESNRYVSWVSGNRWNVGLPTIKGDYIKWFVYEIAETEADAWAKLYLYLKEG